MLDPQGLKLAFTITGSFGPAVAGSLLIRLQTVERDAGPARWSGFLIGAVLGLIAIALIWIMGGFGIDVLIFPEDSPAHVYAAFVLPVLLSGWVYSSIQSRNPRLRALYKGLVPDRQALFLVVPVLLFLPVVLLIGNALADVMGMAYDAPMYTTMSLSAMLPFLMAKMFTAALMTGGNEEQGWRAVLLPILQKSVNPLVATLLITIVWELWHLPLTLGGVYGDGNAITITLLRLTGMLPFALILTALYNTSRGSVFLCVLFHACYNSEVMMFGGSQLATIIAAIVVAAIVIRTRMWRRESAHELESTLLDQQKPQG
jgi:membrane protease YdiL (CAAX protease family)